jgi:hypothetical protein
VNIKPGCNAAIAIAIAMAIAAFGLAGCIPTLLTAQPKAQIVVTENSGAPLQGATVTLGTVEVHGRVGNLTRQEFLTDKYGKVAIKRKRDLTVLALFPDGGRGYWWSLCVAKPGFQAVAIATPKFEQPVQVALTASPIKSECSWSRDRMWPQVVEWTARQWIEVEGGLWTPNDATMVSISDAMQAVAESSAQGYRRELHPWSEYLFQYQGRMTGTTPYVYIKALCRTPADVDLRKTFYESTDDGSCFFGMTYDARRARFDSFEMNAAVTESSPSR